MQARTQPVLHLLLGHVLARYGKEAALKSIAMCADSPILAYSAELLLYLALEVHTLCIYIHTYDIYACINMCSHTRRSVVLSHTRFEHIYIHA